MGLIFDDPVEDRAFMEADFSVPVSQVSPNGHDRDGASINASESVPIAAEHGQTPMTDSNSNQRSYHDEMVARFEDWINYPQQQVAGPSRSANPSYADPVWPAQEEIRASRYNSYTTSRRQQLTETLAPMECGEFNDAPAVKRPRLNPLPVAATGKKKITQLRSLQRGIPCPVGQQNHGFQDGSLGRGGSQAGEQFAPFTFRTPHGPSPLSRSVSYPAPTQANPLPVFAGSVSGGLTSTTSSASGSRADSGVVVPSATALPSAISITNTLSRPPSHATRRSEPHTCKPHKSGRRLLQ
ncbi:hypothetical protein AC578_2430 [Pseudocercospora eumusae]|uniref:Uncharacterized protein n=1 Tax=Pseudocercospora eumusae TaxID=321146 RepID=A0A139HXV9_9PEZI|nr:hypothetical protein AC578_2430 [Pseudocercospora eumusae]